MMTEGHKISPCAPAARAVVVVAALLGCLTASGECRPDTAGPAAGHSDKAAAAGRGRPRWGLPRQRREQADRFAYLNDWTSRPSSCDQPVPHKRFFIYRFTSFAALFPDTTEAHAAQLRKIKTKAVEWKQNVGASLFFLQHIEDHPWRTTRPEEADLFIIPPVLDLVMKQAALSNITLRSAQQLLIQELEASPWFQRRQGRDHLLLFHFGGVKNKIFKQRDPQMLKDPKQLKEVARNMIYAFRYQKKGLTFGVPERWVPEGVDIVVFPHLSALGLRSCTVVPRVPPQAGDMQSKLQCVYHAESEDTFEKFLANREMNLFFAATAGRSTQGKDLRGIAIESLADVYPPSYVSNTRKQRISNQKFAGYMSSSKLSLHVRGHDATSSRVVDAWSAGTPQMFLARRFFKDVGFFKCRISWDKVVLPLNEYQFGIAPKQTTEEAMDGLMMNDNAGLRELWRRQRAVAKDVLWHVPGSRVGVNLLEDAIRTIQARGL